MSTPSAPVPLDLEAAAKTIEIASKELAHLCNEKWAGRDGWHWEIPANPERDTDIRIGDAIGIAQDAVKEIHSLREEVTRLKALPIAVTAFAIPTSTGGHKGVTP